MVRFGGCGRIWDRSQINQGTEGNCCVCLIGTCLCIKSAGSISWSGLVVWVEGGTGLKINQGNCCRCPMHKFCLCIKGSLSGEIP